MESKKKTTLRKWAARVAETEMQNEYVGHEVDFTIVNFGRQHVGYGFNINIENKMHVN